MGMLDDIKAKVQGLAGSHGDKAKDAGDKGTDMADEKTERKYSGQIDQGAEAAKDAIDDAAAAGKE